MDTSVIVGAANYDSDISSYEKMRRDRDDEKSAEVCAINQ